MMHLVHAVMGHGALGHLAVLHLARLHRLRALGPNPDDQSRHERPGSESDHERSVHGFLLSDRLTGVSMPTEPREVCDLGHAGAPPRAASARRPESRITMPERTRLIAPARSS